LSDDYSAQKLHYSAHPRIMPMVHFGSYGLEQDPLPPSHPPFNRSDYSHALKTNQVPHSSEIILVGDGEQIHKNDVASYQLEAQAYPSFLNIDYSNGNGVGYSNIAQYGTVPQLCTAPLDSQVVVQFNQDFVVNNGSPLAGMIRFRHYNNTSANFLFCDGHVGAFHCSKTQNAKVLSWTGGSQQPSYKTDLLRKNVYIPYIPAQ
jgi:prepilin-type processing-associated H-X9-DG protein